MKAAVHWAPQEITRFYRGFLKYGTEFDKVSKTVGGGKAPDMCEALFRQHQAYLSLDKKHQSEVAFVAMVQDAFNHLKEEQPASMDGGSGAEEQEGLQDGESGRADVKPTSEGAVSGGAGRPARSSRGTAAAAVAAAAAAAMSEGEEDMLEEGEGSEGERPRSSRPKRTPKRSRARTPPGVRSAWRTPQSGGKRSRAAASLRDDDIYEYYDPALEALTESARKRRASAKRLDFQGAGAAAGAGGGGVGRRREAADEAKGIDALLSLAVAGEEFGGGGGEGGEGEEAGGEEGAGAAAGGSGAAAAAGAAGGERGGGRKSGGGGGGVAAKRERGGESAGMDEEETEEEEEEEEDQEVEAGAVEDEEDDDYWEAPSRSKRRTPTSTPQRARSRPGSTHVTPRRTGSRGVTSPAGLRGLGSPAWLGLSDNELGIGELGIPDLSYLSSPGFMTALPPGYVPSPKNPMPRLRRRKYAPTKSPPVVSPLRSLFGSRRQSLAGGPPPLLPPAFGSSAFGGGGPAAAAPGGVAATAAAAAGEDGATAMMAPLEVQLRHCLNARVRRWCQFEFFYSAIDRPWFMQSPLQALLSHLGMGSVSKLTRKEWSLVRAGLGKPRRLSLKFLREERARLEAWRESVRAHYAATGAPDAPPVDPAVAANFPRALNVGQRVTARHPTTRQIHDGSVLTAAPNCYRIQFDRRELGVELVRDCDIMPADPAENLPPALLAANPLLLLNGRYIVGGQPVRPPAPRAVFPLAFSTLPAVTPAAAAAAFSRQTPQQQQQQQLLMQHHQQQQQQQQQQQPSLAAQMQQAAQQAAQQQQQQEAQPAVTPLQSTPPEASAGTAAPAISAPSSAATATPAPDSAQRAAMSAAEAQALSELAVSLDKKEALLVQLRAMNDEAAAGVHAVRGGAGGGTAGGAAAGDTSQAFKLAYAKVVLQLRDTNERVAAKLMELEALRSGALRPEGEEATPAAAPAAGEAPGSAAQAPPVPETAEGLAAASLQEARTMVAACRRKLADAAADAGSSAAAVEAAAGGGLLADRSTAGVAGGSGGGQATEAIDWEHPTGRLLGGVIEGCVWSLLALQRGCSSTAPWSTLAGALDTALQAVRPHAAANQQLYADIKQAMDALRAQLLVAS